MPCTAVQYTIIAGRLKLTDIIEIPTLQTGKLDADLDAVIENGICDVRNLRFAKCNVATQ